MLANIYAADLGLLIRGDPKVFATEHAKYQLWTNPTSAPENSTAAENYQLPGSEGTLAQTGNFLERGGRLRAERSHELPIYIMCNVVHGSLGFLTASRKPLKTDSSTPALLT